MGDKGSEASRGQIKLGFVSDPRSLYLILKGKIKYFGFEELPEYDYS